MVSEASSTSSSDQDIASAKSVKRCSSRKSSPKRIAKKVHKSEREKLKRDQLNILFVQLSKCLDSVHQNHGKASALTETTKLVGDLLSQIECLKKDNTSLLSESQYLTIERNELKEENDALKGEIMDMQNKLGEMTHSQQDGGGGHGMNSSQLMEENIFVKLSHQSHLVVIPSSSLQQAETFIEEDVVSPSDHVIRRPHARYPSPCWPSQILNNQTHTAEPLNISTDISKETVSLA